MLYLKCQYEDCKEKAVTMCFCEKHIKEYSEFIEQNGMGFVPERIK